MKISVFFMVLFFSCAVFAGTEKHHAKKCSEIKKINYEACLKGVGTSLSKDKANNYCKCTTDKLFGAKCKSVKEAMAKPGWDQKGNDVVNECMKKVNIEKK